MSGTGKDISPSTCRVGWIGTGVMGFWMCRHVMGKGYAMTVTARTRSKVEPLLAEGAVWAETAKEMAARSDVVFSMVGFPKDVREVYFGENGILAGARPGTILVDMTTTEPSLAREIYEAAASRGIAAVDAPVSGGDIGARNAALSIMAGGDPETVETVRPILQAMGPNIVRQGPAGAGQHAKMCNQIVIAGTVIGVCESLIYGYRAGLDLETMLSSIQGGAARCWTLDALAPRILKRDFSPGFFVEHFIKDMSIALKEAAAMGLSLPGLALVHQLYLAVQANGHGRSGTQALVLALENLAHMEIGK